MKKNIQNKASRSLSVDFWERIFFLLSYISIFRYIRITIKGRNRDWWSRFVDIWVLSNLFLALFAVFVIHYGILPKISNILIIYGFIRVFEILVYQINVLLFDEYRAKIKGIEYSIKGYRRIIINIFNNFGEIIFWFAASYAFFTPDVIDTTISLGELFYNSFSVMTTFGVSKLTPMTDIGLYILWFQSIAGLFMTLLSLSRFIGSLPRAKSMDD